MFQDCNPSLMKNVFYSTILVTSSESRKLIAFCAKFGHLESTNLTYFINATDIIGTFFGDLSGFSDYIKKGINIKLNKYNQKIMWMFLPQFDQNLRSSFNFQVSLLILSKVTLQQGDYCLADHFFIQTSVCIYIKTLKTVFICVIFQTYFKIFSFAVFSRTWISFLNQ